MKNPFDTGYYCSDELRDFGFAHVGENVRVARNCTIMGLENISLGDNSRIDANCTIIALGGPLTLGRYAHVHTSVVLGARGGITLGDFVGISHGCNLVSASDDLSGDWMTNSTLPPGCTNPKVAPIYIGDYTAMGVLCTVLPGVNIGTGCAVYAYSLVKSDLPEWTIAVGLPAKVIRQRSRRLLDKLPDHSSVLSAAA